MLRVILSAGEMRLFVSNMKLAVALRFGRTATLAVGQSLTKFEDRPNGTPYEWTERRAAKNAMLGA